MKNNKIILCSKSPRRFDLLKRCGLAFDTENPDCEELTLIDDLYFLAEKNALLKARSVQRKYPEAILIGADTVIFLNGEIIGKPADLNQAAKILTKLSGKTHQVLTGTAILTPEKTVTFTESSEVTFKSLTMEIIQEYLNQVEVLDKAGAYAIQEHPELIIEKYQGSLNNIIGLPVEKVMETLSCLMK